MPDQKFALLSFSGIPAIHSPPTSDHDALLTFLSTLSMHNFQSTGSSFRASFEGILHMIHHKQDNYQVVLISDGELPRPDIFDEELALLLKKRVVIHTVAAGSQAGSKIKVFRPEDMFKPVKTTQDRP